MTTRYATVERRLFRALVLVVGLLVLSFGHIATGQEPVLRFVQWNDMHVEDPPPGYALANEKVEYLVDAINDETYFPLPDFVGNVSPKRICVPSSVSGSAHGQSLPVPPKFLCISPW